MTHPRICSRFPGSVQGTFQSPADAQRKKIPLSTHSARAAGAKIPANTAQAAPTASAGDEPLAALLELAYEVLGIRCDPSENFFDHGDSMAAAQLCALAARRHGWSITPRDIFAWESFTLLAGVIERDEAERRATAAAPTQGVA
jgi:phosphopantetheine binding protein